MILLAGIRRVKGAKRLGVRVGDSRSGKAVYLPSYKRPGRMRAGSQHYRTLLEDGKENRERVKHELAMPVLVLAASAAFRKAKRSKGVDMLLLRKHH